jgi:hypothetical protein
LVFSGVILLLVVGHLTFEAGDGRRLPATMSVSLLLGVVAVGYGALRFYAGGTFYFVLTVVALLVAFVGSTRPYLHRLEVLGPYYQLKDEGGLCTAEGRFADKSSLPEGKPDLTQYWAYHNEHAKALAKRKVPGAEVDRLQLDEGDVLRAWSAGLQKPAAAGLPAPGKPPLVIVTTAGGATTSALYTYAVLTNLEKWFPGFHRHVRLVTGASGGMLGAAYYRALLQKWDELTPDEQKKFDSSLAEYLDHHRHYLEADFLSPIVQATAFKDVPKYLGCPSGYSDDRGRRLEDAWSRGLLPTRVDGSRKFGALDLEFRKLRDQERTGKYPSLVFSPMMVEDGRPLLISALDLGDLVRTPDGTCDPVDPLRPFRALEFFKLFPERGWDLSLATAVRLSATFPYLSPAATLPTLPPRRLVDAGYYDNYGMDVALGWIEQGSHPRHHRFLGNYTDRVVLINLRPYSRVASAGSPLTQEEWDAWDMGETGIEDYGCGPDGRLRAAADPGKGAPASGRNGGSRKHYLPDLSDPLQPVTTVPDGGEAARRTGMVARNNNLLRVLLRQVSPVTRFPEKDRKSLGGIFRALNADPMPDIRVATFRGDSTASLNWTLPRGQIEQLVAQAGKPFLPPNPKSPPDVTLQRRELEAVADALKDYFP